MPKQQFIDPATIPTRDYIKVFKALREQLSEQQVHLLKAHYSAPNRIITARQMAKAVGYKSWPASNSQYGRLAAKLREFLGPGRKDAINLLAEFVKPGTDENPGREWGWKFRPAAAKAYEKVFKPDILSAFPKKSKRYRVLETNNEVAKTWKLLRSVLINSSKKRPYKRQIGFPGGNEKGRKVYWNEKNKFWCSFDSFEVGNRYVLWLGDKNPQQLHQLEIVCQINSPHEGRNRRCAGLYVEDPKGDIFLAHTGRLGGGREGATQEAFQASSSFEKANVRFNDGLVGEVFLIGRINSADFPGKLGKFIREASAFKKAVSEHGPRTYGKGKLLFPRDFTPEFEGTRRTYRNNFFVEAQCDHGQVVNDLADRLAKKEYKTRNNKNCDLVIVDENENMLALFEIKTSASLSHCYQAIGQLLFHSHASSTKPRLFMVIPGQPDAKTSKVLNALGIQAIFYKIFGSGRIDFSGLDLLP